MSTSAAKRRRSSDMDSQDAKATKKAKSPEGTLKTTGAAIKAATAGSSAGAVNGNGASREAAADNNGGYSHDGKPREQAHLTNGDNNSGKVESRPPQNLRQETKASGVDQGKAAASATDGGGSKAKTSSSSETASTSSISTKTGYEEASVSSWAWYYTILFWVAGLLFLTNVVTLGLWLETKMEYELLTTELQEQVKELPQVLQDVAAWQEFGRIAEEQVNGLQEQVKELPQILQDFAAWQEFGRITERYRNDCADSLKEVLRERGGECIDAETECPIWVEDDQCFQNPGFMLLTCRLSCDAC